MSRASKRRLALFGGALLVCLVAAIAAAVTVNVLNSRRGPEHEVRAYLDLIAAGEASAATAMVDPGVPNDERLLLSDEALAGASARMQVVEVEEVSRSEEQAVVEATISLDGERLTQSFDVAAGDKDYGLLDTWQVRTPAVSKVNLGSSSLSSLSVAGVEVPLERTDYGGSATTQYAYFGIYGVEVPSTHSTYLTADTASLIVRPMGQQALAAPGESLVVDAVATQELETLVLNAVEAQANSCVTPPTNLDDVCPSTLSRTNLALMEVTVPVTEVEVDGATSFTSGPITFRTREIPTEWNEDPDARTASFVFEGTIEWSADGEPTISVTDSRQHYGSS